MVGETLGGGPRDKEKHVEVITGRPGETSSEKTGGEIPTVRDPRWVGNKKDIGMRVGLTGEH